MSRASAAKKREERGGDRVELELAPGQSVAVEGLGEVSSLQLERVTAALRRILSEEPSEDLLDLTLRPGESVSIIGVSQYGKSKKAKEKAAQLRAQRKRVAAWDPCWEWGVDALRRKHTPPGPLAKTVTVDDLERNPEMLLAPDLSLAVRPVDIYAPREEIAAQFKRFIYIIRTHQPADEELHLFVDECGLLRKYCEEALDDLVERGGKDGLYPYLLGQRWSHFGPNQRAEFAYLVALAQHKTSDLRFLAQDAGKDFAAAICVQEPHEYRIANLRRVHADALASVSNPQKEEDNG